MKNPFLHLMRYSRFMFNIEREFAILVKHLIVRMDHFINDVIQYC